MLFLYALMVCVGLGAAGCDSSDPEEEDVVIEGVNFTQLFAEPTDDEIETVLRDWSSRDVATRNVQVVHTARTQLGKLPATVRVVSHSVGGVTHYGGVIAPDGASASLPVVVYAHGGDGGVDLDDTVLLLGIVQSPFVFVVPSFRSEKLTYGNLRYQSGGAPSPWDYDVDDALALLTAALETTPQANPNRIAVLGFSRGGGVGLLMAARDERIDQVVEFFGPTDFYGPYVQRIAREALQGKGRDLPGFDVLNATLIQPLKAGSISTAQVRDQLLRRSPAYFAERLPQVQVHHGMADSTVHVSQAEALIAAMQELGRKPPEFESYLYPGGTHDPFSMPGSLGLAQLFLTRPLAPPAQASQQLRHAY